jgi:outer membrane biosynthesis protein TonB
MRASNFPGLSTALPLILLLAGSSCTKEVKADFPRPPVTATMKPPPVETPDEGDPESASEEPEPESAEPEPQDEPEPEKPTPPPTRSRPAAESSEPPKGEAAKPEPPSTQLAGSSSVDPALAAKLDRASALLGSIGVRDLTPGQTEQLTAARAFVIQARRALEEGDPRRALVLIDKGLILAEDVERVSRP